MNIPYQSTFEELSSKYSKEISESTNSNNDKNEN